MGFTKRELIEFLDGLVELASEENKVKAVLAKEKFVSDFENTYGYEKEVITEITKLPPHCMAKDAPLFSDHKIISPADAVEVIGNFLCEMDREVMCVINLKSDGTPINCNIVSIGAINQTIAEPREFFKSSILSNAAGMIMVHNHPSGELVPSRQDVLITHRILELTELMGIRLADHVIVGGDNSQYFSFSEKKLLQYPSFSFTADYNELDFGKTAMVAEKGKAR